MVLIAGRCVPCQCVVRAVEWTTIRTLARRVSAIGFRDVSPFYLLISIQLKRIMGFKIYIICNNVSKLNIKGSWSKWKRHYDKFRGFSTGDRSINLIKITEANQVSLPSRFLIGRNHRIIAELIDRNLKII